MIRGGDVSHSLIWDFSVLLVAFGLLLGLASHLYPNLAK